MRTLAIFAAFVTSVTPVTSGFSQSDTIARSEGATDWFGDGVTGVRGQGTMVRLALRQPANVIGLRIEPTGIVRVVGNASLDSGRRWMRLTAPTRADPTAPVAAPESACQVAIGRIVPVGAPTAAGTRACPIIEMPMSLRGQSPRESGATFLLMIVSDSAFTADEIGQRLNTIRQFHLETVVHDLPEYLVGRRTAMWAGYLVRL